jgi:hypothetical protein
MTTPPVSGEAISWSNAIAAALKIAGGAVLVVVMALALFGMIAGWRAHLGKRTGRPFKRHSKRKGWK